MRVSAVIPCYNGAPWLRMAIKSIQAQIRPVYELIVVDDGSTDGSAEIALDAGASVERLNQNMGEGAARNAGIRRSSGDAVAFLDADDLWAPDHVSTLCGLLEEYPQASASFAATQRFGKRHEMICGYIPPGPPVNVFWAAFSDWLHSTISSMIRRSVLMELNGFSENERYSVDFDFWLRLSRNHLVVSTHKVTSFWRWHDAQQSNDPSGQMEAVYRFRRRYWENERDNGDPVFAGEIKTKMREIWEREMSSALASGDGQRQQLYRKLGNLLP